MERETDKIQVGPSVDEMREALYVEKDRAVYLCCIKDSYSLKSKAVRTSNKDRSEEKRWLDDDIMFRVHPN
jgi:hypothetical protein